MWFSMATLTCEIRTGLETCRTVKYDCGGGSSSACAHLQQSNQGLRRATVILSFLTILLKVILKRILKAWVMLYFMGLFLHFHGLMISCEELLKTNQRKTSRQSYFSCHLEVFPSNNCSVNLEQPVTFSFLIRNYILQSSYLCRFSTNCYASNQLKLIKWKCIN